MRCKNLLVVWLLALCISSCAKIAIMAAPKKFRSSDRSDAAIKADEFFWTHFHLGDYQKIENILAQLKAAYFIDPRDWLTAAHIGFAHAWRLAERSRLIAPPPNIIDDAELSRFYFSEAHNLNEKDPRIFGFLADMTIISGDIHQDEKKIRHGYFLGLDAIRQWPEFNLFTLGYIMSSKSADSERFKEGLAWQWKNLDLCIGEKIDRKNPDISPYMKNEEHDKQIRKKSVCWNSWIAPHNFEGFFLNMGDMLLKAGEKNAAIAIYSNARLSRTYQDWPYRHVLEQRLILARDAREGVAEQFAPKPMMLESSFNCMACHQAQ